MGKNERKGRREREKEEVLKTLKVTKRGKKKVFFCLFFNGSKAFLNASSIRSLIV